MKALRTLWLWLLLLLIPAFAFAQNDSRVAEQKRVIEALERQIASEEAQIAKLRTGRSATEERVGRLARQLESRTQLLDRTEEQATQLREQIARKDSLAGGLQTTLDRTRAQYAAMVREAYRNYRQHNYLTYIFAARDFRQAARRIVSLRRMAADRERKLEEIAALRERVGREKRELDDRKRSLDSVSQKLTAQKRKLETDTRNARADLKKLSRQEKTALQRKVSRQRELDAAIGELRKLTKGNTTGASFSAKTSGLHLPVEGGRVKRYKENMAEISGPKGARVISIYEGKVMEIKRNRITGKYDVYVAHGEYITSYANLGGVAVEKGQKVAKNQPLGTIGSAVDVSTMNTEYKLVFGIYPPNPATKLRAENCFRK